MNTKDPQELAEARDMLIAQKPLVQAYGVDDIRDKLASGEAALGVIYSGEAINLLKPIRISRSARRQKRAPISGWTAGSSRNRPSTPNAHKFIDFLCRPDIAAKNFKALGYSTPNTGVRGLVEDDMDEEELAVAFPDPSVYQDRRRISISAKHR